MGACYAKLTISDELFLELKGRPDPHTLLTLQLHYEMYDGASQKKIDEVCQFALMANGTPVIG
jgi:hypothetical protein